MSPRNRGDAHCMDFPFKHEKDPALQVSILFPQPLKAFSKYLSLPLPPFNEHHAFKLLTHWVTCHFIYSSTTSS